MDIKVFDRDKRLAEYAAGLFREVINGNEHPVLGLATGASPVETYKALIKLYKNGKLSFKNVTAFNLDEYCGLPLNDKNSYHTFMMENLFDHVDINIENVHIPDGNTDDPERYALEYDNMISAAGGIDIQLLGIGVNGHIGFNEPDEAFSGGTHKVRLTASTLKANSRYFTDSEMPRYALTMGIGTIMSAKKIVLIATGKAKAEAVYNTVKGEVTPLCPASILQTHKDALLLLDEAAASML